MNENLYILQWNAWSIVDNRASLQHFLNNSYIHFVVISELWVEESHNIILKGYEEDMKKRIGLVGSDCKTCNVKFHTSCASFKDSWQKVLTDCKNMFWMCDPCKNNFSVGGNENRAAVEMLRKEIDCVNREKILTDKLLSEVQYTNELQKALLKQLEDKVAALENTKHMKYSEAVKSTAHIPVKKHVPSKCSDRPEVFVNNIVLLNDSVSELKSEGDIKFITKLNRLHGIDVVIEVAPYLHKWITQRGFLYVGWKKCYITDHIRVKRCFKCCGLGHLDKDCRAQVCCPKCSGDHKLKECKSDCIKCANCINYNNRTVFCGDFNSHHGLCGYNDDDAQGKILVDLVDAMEIHNLVILNDGRSTRIISPQCINQFSAVDLTLVSPTLADIIDWNVLTDTMESDHFPIKITLSVNLWNIHRISDGATDDSMPSKKPFDLASTQPVWWDEERRDMMYVRSAEEGSWQL
nr:unnamed protein product [Callosobruchus chinensis]